MGHDHHRRIQPLDGLRGISILLVLIAHAGYGHIVPGGFGVTIFFFISGYIITKLLLAELKHSNDIDLSAFYTRRAFRILPALLVYLAVSTLYVWSVSGFVDWPHLAAAIFNYYNYYYIYFLGHQGEFSPYHPYAIVWSLAVEEHYYMIFPLAIFLARRHIPSFAKALIFLCVAALLWRFYLLLSGTLADVGINRTYKATDTRFDSIVYGALFAICASLYGEKFIAALKHRALTLLAVVLFVMSFLIRGWEFRETARYTLQGVALFIIFWSVLDGRSYLGRVLSSRVFVYFGKISYSLYLWHWLVFVVVHKAFPSPSDTLLAAGLVIGSSVLLAHASYLFVERPALAIKTKYFS
jgi:peptidoglycan/LPS O-acetylase OafA/YrhL